MLPDAVGWPCYLRPEFVRGDFLPELLGMPAARPLGIC